MVLCEIAEASGHNFFAIWFCLALFGLLSVMTTSCVLFYYYYWPTQVTYEKWCHKTNPKFPSPAKVRDEIVQMLKGIAAGVILPATALWLTGQGKGQAYCGMPEGRGISYLIGSFVLIMGVTDFWSWEYHRLGHTASTFWGIHRHHHVFFNPSPFAVIADEWIDQFLRAAPMLFLPLCLPINIDLLFFEFALFFHSYGLYLHWGYETDLLSAHNPIMNTAFQHYCHHAKAILHKPYHCGFYFKIWDQLSGGMYPEDKCFCVQCERAKGNRSEAAWKKVVVPDYSVLLQPSFWMSTQYLTGLSASDQNDMTEEEKYFETKGGKCS
jgi:lathosterol oxidase